MAYEPCLRDVTKKDDVEDQTDDHMLNILQLRPDSEEILRLIHLSSEARTLRSSIS